MAELTVQLGPAHTDTLHFKGGLAILLEEMGERAEARRMYEEVVAGQTSEPAGGDGGPCWSPATVPSPEEVVAGFTAQLGPEHPHTKRAAENLATCVRQLRAPAAAAVACLLVAILGVLVAVLQPGLENRQ